MEYYKHRIEQKNDGYDNDFKGFSNEVEEKGEFLVEEKRRKSLSPILLYEILICFQNESAHLPYRRPLLPPEMALFGLYPVNNPAASNGAWNLKRCKQRGIDPRGIRQMSMQAWPFDSLLAGINAV
ncbi:MAG: hypothetical protein NC417_12975 [Candidatus Gastranaerophilales bacterium]|nr:hypothetical protein [Candidatus Gastranaerophilales bacterium]